MKWLRKLLGTDFPDPEAGQWWLSLNSLRSIRVVEVRCSDDGVGWFIDLQHQDNDGFNPVAMTYYMSPGQWRRKLRDEGRILVRGIHLPPRPIPPQAPRPDNAFTGQVPPFYPPPGDPDGSATPKPAFQPTKESTMNLEINWKGDLQRIQPKPGDVFVLSVDKEISDEQACRIREHWKAMVGEGLPLVVIGAGVRLDVVAEASL
ncbi:MAG: hypothetical protein V4669_13780 [Pseudomonadota bacterium]